MPDRNETNDGGKPVVEEASNWLASAWEEIRQIASDAAETFFAEDDPYNENLAEDSAKQAETEAASESAASGEESKLDSVDPAEPAKRSVERAKEGRIIIEVEGSVIEHPGTVHSVTPGEFAENFKEVTLEGAKFYVDQRNLDVSTIKSATNGSIEMVQHPNLVATRVHEAAKGDVLSSSAGAPAGNAPGASTDFGKGQVESIRSGTSAGLLERAPASEHVLNVEAKETSWSVESGEVAGTSRRNGPKSIGEGVAPREGVESRAPEEKFHEPHDPIYEIGGAVALGFAAWWGADWYFSSKEDQSRAAKPSESSVPVTGVDP